MPAFVLILKLSATSTTRERDSTTLQLQCIPRFPLYLNTATPYAGRSYANEYSLPSHSLSTALYITGWLVPRPPKRASSPSSTSRYVHFFTQPTR